MTRRKKSKDPMRMFVRRKNREKIKSLEKERKVMLDKVSRGDMGMVEESCISSLCLPPCTGFSAWNVQSS
jgi:hypothetical protein